MADLGFESLGLAPDIASGGLIVLAFREVEQLDSVRNGLGRAVEVGDLRRQARALAPELLRPLGLAPDRGILELARDFL